ncbi:response regulator transcription factor [Candidatus Methylacidithermus pantelleriae]|uniref:DNA-binding transcriptional dual regulator PhoB n=1 Tax=Candidatus Methylacidithermus pantelleriae TaxID=2744239 RepID=A0A8J2BJ30_9BACT|nr:response regulator transcription factor [Candidatus Methylacidithermus pantelleriae]CAF0695921.1 DNA-binding transcriptional dual regulator PhoB [Candidatus Methylacidithermus pantelleriae]
MIKRKILVVEDEPDVLALIRMTLEAQSFRVAEARSGSAALEQIRRHPPDLVVLDLMLPEMSGLEVCRSVRADPLRNRLPILVLTAKGEEVDRVVGFEVGADDYVTKPFSPRELVLRVRSLLRRAYPTEEFPQLVECGPLRIQPEEHRAWIEGRPLDLTATEFRLLLTLVLRRNRVQRRQTLLNEVWGYDSLIDTRTVDTHIRRLREKLGSVGWWIQTVRGVGYRFVEPQGEKPEGGNVEQGQSSGK